MRYNLYMFRCSKKLSQAELAAKVGVSRATYGNIEQGKRSGQAEFWNNLQKAFDVPDEQMYSLMKREERE